jgi:basic amino acid/polyamine antiporter, APA family
MTAVEPPPDVTESLPVFSRKATGLVRELGIRDQIIFNLSGTGTLGIALVFVLTALLLFPHANLYIAIPIAIVLCVVVWTTYALLSAAIPRVGGDYTFTSRIISPRLGFAFNLCLFLSSALSAGIWAWWMSTQGLSPVFTVIGSVTGSHTFLNWGNSFSPSHHRVTFVTGLIALSACMGLAIRGMRITMRVMGILFTIAAVAWLADILILLFTSHASFVNSINGIGGAHAYAKTVAAAPPAGYTSHDTIGALYDVMTAIVYVYWGAYITSEFKGGNRRNRQLSTMVGAGSVQALLVFVAVVVLLKTVGHAFLSSAVAGNFAAPGGATVGTAGYTYFAALVARNTIPVAILSLAFLGWFLPGQFINSGMAYRALFTWSFDGLLPKRFTEVNDRTHTPVTAILVAYLFGLLGLIACAFDSSKFLAILGVILLFNYLPLFTVGLSAFTMRWRRPDLYAGSPADWKVAGIPVTQAAGLGTSLIGAGLIFIAFYYHNQLGITDTPAILGLTYHQLEWILPLLTMLVAFIWYQVAMSIYARRGIDMTLAFKSIPPE